MDVTEDGRICLMLRANRILTWDEISDVFRNI